MPETSRNFIPPRGLPALAVEIAVEIAAVSAAVAVLVAILAAVMFPAVKRSLVRSSRLDRVDRINALLARAPASSVAACRAGLCAPGALLFDLDPAGAHLASWGNIGGCGVGGTGGGGGARWIGRRSGGAPVEFELLGSASVGEDLTSNSLTFKVTADAPWRLNLGLQVPLISNKRAYEYSAGVTSTEEIDGFGDVSLLISRQFGLEGSTSASLTVGLATAEYDRSIEGTWVPYDAQLGIGRPTLDVIVEHNLNRDWGPVIFGGAYTYNGGENEIENRRGDKLRGYCYFGYRTDRFVHSVGASLSYALQKDRNIGVEIADQSAVLLTLQYGVEFSITYRVPVFLALVATLGEESSQNSMSFALGVVASF